MLYLLDANTLIAAKNAYYPIDRVPEFWEWIVYQGQVGNIKVPIEVYEEFKETKQRNGEKDSLSLWAEQPEVQDALLLSEQAQPNLVSLVTYAGYAEDPTDEEVAKMGRDPFLISYAVADSAQRCIVTTEVSKPSRQRANRHVPDVCNTLGIRWINNFQLIHELNFTTAWKAATSAPV